MAYCFSCRREVPGTEGLACPVCGTTWGLQPASPDPNQRELFESIEVARVPDEISAMALRGFLLDAGVEAVVEDRSGSFYGNTLSGGQGYWGSVRVSKEQAEQAGRILEKFRKEFEGR